MNLYFDSGDPTIKYIIHDPILFVIWYDYQAWAYALAAWASSKVG